MPRTIAVTALAAALSLPLIVGATTANASCDARKNTGTLLGGVGGALLGNSVSRGGGGAIVGGLGGAVLGHEIAKSGCSHYRPTASHSRRTRHVQDRYAGDRPVEPARKIYYDQYGNALIAPAPAYGH